jgi:hypothetical protein
LAAIFAGLEFTGLPNQQRLQPKGQATPHANLAALRPSIALEWDWLAAVHLSKNCRQEAAAK